MEAVGAMSKSFGMRASVVTRVNLLGRNCDSSRSSIVIHSLNQCQFFTKFTKFTKIFYYKIIEIRAFLKQLHIFFFLFRKKANRIGARDMRVVEVIGVIMGVVGTMSRIIRDTSA